MFDNIAGFTPDPNQPFIPEEVPRIFDTVPTVEIDALRLRYGPSTVTILIVVDGSIQFNNIGFGLGRVISTLKDTAHPDFPSYARFNIKTATRAPQETPFSVRDDAEQYNFVFNQNNLRGIDELWLFGIDQESNFISDNEVSAVADFMDAGGGVLAMGDHEDLGLGLCGKLPRVRSMRKWWFDPLPAGESKAPDNADLTRIDTVQPVVPGANPNFGSQSDTTPQPVYPNYRVRFSGGKIVKYPHELLCGPRGVIKVFPDHAHEGFCVVPSDLSQPLVEGSTSPEYPGGVAPEVIATGRTVAGRTKSGYTLPSSTSFGLLGAYNGHHHGAEVGRVVVDATWHHWFNVNLNAFATSANPVTQTHWHDIQAFFRNCAIWLAPKTKQSAMRRAGKIISFHIYPLNEFIPTLVRKNDIFSIYQLGIYARNALGRVASQCQTYQWIIIELERLLPEFFQEFDIDMTKEISPLELQPIAYSHEVLMMSAYGGAVKAMWEAMEKTDAKGHEKLVDSLDDIAMSGAKEAYKMAHKMLNQSCKRLDKLLDS